MRMIRIAPWINRLVLAFTTLLFTAIGLRYIHDPVGTSAAIGVTIASTGGAATTRIGLGAFPLAFAIFSLLCLTSSRRLLTGVSLVATVVATVIVVRLFSLLVDGPAPASTRLFIPEGIVLSFCIAGIALETARQRRAETAA